MQLWVYKLGSLSGCHDLRELFLCAPYLSTKKGLQNLWYAQPVSARSLNLSMLFSWHQLPQKMLAYKTICCLIPEHASPVWSPFLQADAKVYNWSSAEEIIPLESHTKQAHIHNLQHGMDGWETMWRAAEQQVHYNEITSGWLQGELYQRILKTRHNTEKGQLGAHCKIHSFFSRIV